eukprot:CAMPEP_0116849678 /NCGR_PEP_ID=MMETSP0418-20121206/15711_1 /TAXON_ID=1158023 /ORGANISM="Astrosyne radiata, Strain 13vi08-1A" /LENGTH=235 /DNA_ID=CAMNT_0004481437 /DNA_START=19 /DNA_END=727 /DNA_ORIENTATION=+
MSRSYEEYDTEYQSYLSRIRSFLASTRSQSTLKECERLLGEARKCVTAMQGLAEVEGDQFKVEEAQKRLEQDIAPLQKEVTRGLGDVEAPEDSLFYQPPTNNDENGSASLLTTEALIQSSEDLLANRKRTWKETEWPPKFVHTHKRVLFSFERSLCSETEQIGMSTLTQMGQQREQMQIASDNMDATLSMTMQARALLRQIRTKILRNKLVLYSMIAFLVLANCFVIYRIWKKNH